MAAIYWVSSESDPLPQVSSLVWDKILHTSEYAGLALLLIRALFGEGLSWSTSALAAVILSSVYGASDEWHQVFVPLREADISDWLADTIGASAGAFAYMSWWRFKPGLARESASPQ